METTKQSNATVETVDKRTQRGSSKLGSWYLVESPVGQCRCKEGDIDKFRISVLLSILDCLNAELNRRFSKNNCDTTRGIQALNPKGESCLGCLYGCDVMRT